MNGIESALSINEGNGCRTIYMSAYTDKATIQAANSTKNVGFLYKPFETFQLKEVVEKALPQAFAADQQ